MFFQQLTGINVLIYFAGTILKPKGGNSDDTNTIISNLSIAVNFLTTIIIILIIDRNLPYYIRGWKKAFIIFWFYSFNLNIGNTHCCHIQF